MKYISFIKNLLFLNLFFILVSPVEASLLKIDFSQKSTPVQSGFQGYQAEHEIANSFIPQSFQVEEKTVTIKIEWPAGTPNTAMQMIDRGSNSNSTMNDLLRDWIGTDGRVAKVPLILTISGLAAGSY